MTILRRIFLIRFTALMFAAVASSSPKLYASNVTYIYTDPQGTPLAEADSQGNVVSTSDYRPYGRQALGNAKDGPGYTAQVNDTDVSLMYMQARYYDEQVGAFLSTDAQGVRAGNIYNFGRFAYAYNNPVVLQDPSGMVPTRGSEDGYPFEYYGPDSGMCDSCNGAAVAQVQSTSQGSDSTSKQVLSYKSLSDSRGLADGSLDWKIKWILKSASKNGGYIIQEFTARADAIDFDGKSMGTFYTHFWEAFHVSKGESSVDNLNDYDDEFRFGGAPGSASGHYSAEGTARFYEGLTLPSDFVPGSVRHAGDLPATTVNPNLSSKNATDPVVRKVSTSWGTK